MCQGLSLHCPNSKLARDGVESHPIREMKRRGGLGCSWMPNDKETGRRVIAVRLVVSKWWVGEKAVSPASPCPALPSLLRRRTRNWTGVANPQILPPTPCQERQLSELFQPEKVNTHCSMVGKAGRNRDAGTDEK